MGANSPTTASVYNEIGWKSDSLAALLAPRFMTSRMEDLSSEVKGFKGQVLNLGEYHELDDSDVGANGEVTPIVYTPILNTLTVNRWRNVTMDWVDIHDLQVKYGKSGWSKYIGEGLRKGAEKYFLSLETGVPSANTTDVAGSITETVMNTLLADTISGNWLDGNKHMIISPSQMGDMLLDDVFKESTFVGENNLFMKTGKISMFLGFEFLVSSLCRRRDVSGTTRTINTAWRGGEGGAFVKAFQQEVKMKHIQIDLSERVIGSVLYGGAINGSADRNQVELLRTTNP